jgi:Glycine-rich protein domain (DUF2403)/Putative TOS1-like glycosyl hydrolase (DUF2401)
VTIALLALAACVGSAPARQPEDGAARSRHDATVQSDLDGAAQEAASADAPRTAHDGGTTPQPARGDSGEAIAPAPAESGVGSASFADDDLDPVSHGGTITFQEIGASGWYPSRRDPKAGPCDAYQTTSCCMAKREVADDQLTPWDEELILTLRGPLSLKQLAVYQPAAVDGWNLVSLWDARAPGAAQGVTFRGESNDAARFVGSVGSECLVDVATDKTFPCGPGSRPFCATTSPPHHYGWAGSKLFVLLARMPHAGEQNAGSACSQGTTGNWYDAPWLGLSLGELVRAGAFSDCHCYAKSPDQWWLGDGCGQFNVFEVVNDNNQSQNLELFSTNFFGYGGYVGEGPCGQQCDLTRLAAEADLIDKSSSKEAAQGAVARKGQGPGAAFRRPARGYRYFLVLLNVATRDVQLAIIHPHAIPASIGALLPGLPSTLSQATVNALLGLRLPK